MVGLLDGTDGTEADLARERSARIETLTPHQARVVYTTQRDGSHVVSTKSLLLLLYSRLANTSGVKEIRALYDVLYD
eukprot:2854596-Pyramimonas_sp.AAC.2